MSMSEPMARPEDPASFAATADGITLEALRRKRGAKWTESPPDAIAAWVADSDLPLAPVVTTAIRAAVERGDLGYPHEDGAPVRAWAGWCERRYGWTPDVRHVSQHGNVVAALAACIDLLTEPGEPVVVPVPAYPPFLLAPGDLGRTAVPVPLVTDGSGRPTFDLDAIAAALRAGARLVLLCSPHNPTGRSWSVPELEQLAEVVLRHDGWLVSDEIFADVTLPGARHVPTASLAHEVAARTVTLAAASKAFGIAGLRYALAAAPDPELHMAIRHRRHVRGATPSALGAVATEAAWRGGDGWLDAALAYLDARRADLAAALPSLTGVRCHLPEATYLAWLDLRVTPFAIDPAAKLLAAARVHLSEGTPFGTAGFTRMNLALPGPVLAEALDRLAAAFR
ncbi:aminotransferase class I/II-fold pyridoxal phosphate-dependent enzyme [Micromonospora polyrhachis]|uniref:cysteine-S-conjugate beta-lyase n=1 Tax=Micromonospora polyrhachis TaxID=1282883 RepID=A0A7W7SUX4_9ACTN|nr:aminotransferase class I/II-fold pyridoxal phosphate-dependent enzyme [Micromonospora polyrhachis]MBB4961328.1 cystathionine beta-lyase [Micromonospora polyrhachis]